MLSVWEYNSPYKFPENWNILKIKFRNSNYHPTITESFKFEKIVLTSTQSTSLAC
jgi:hypothetical protein